MNLKTVNKVAFRVVCWLIVVFNLFVCISFFNGNHYLNGGVVVAGTAGTLALMVSTKSPRWWTWCCVLLLWVLMLGVIGFMHIAKGDQLLNY